MGISSLEYKKALVSLEEALSFARSRTNESEFRIARDACIQRFEFCIELAWKISAKQMGSSSTTAKPVIREMAQNGLINNPDQWFEFVNARNQTSHSYDEDVAKQVYAVAEGFLVHGQALLGRIQ
jgi:nucleotidyltransferase substrate binding protein (TIGR01987 family)